MNASGEVSLQSARHPLLVLSGRPVVPNDLKVGRPYLCLILTGPNAGGKSVALKTLGILVLMAMAGLSIPASPDSTVSTFHNAFVAVGDEQSVEGDLSTYSAHIRRLNDILRGADRGSLVLLDEVVSGTDPREGAAIARSFLETLADREVRVIATTHFEELKGIAFTDHRFENGSMAFDGDHLCPTYRLTLGVPGRSMGMEIARSLGFPEEVLTRAAGYLSGPGPNLTEVIDRLEGERDRLRAETAAMAARTREAEEARRKLEADREKVRSEESRVVSQARQKMREELRKAEGELSRIMEEMRKDRTDRHGAEGDDGAEGVEGEGARGGGGPRRAGDDEPHRAAAPGRRAPARAEGVRRVAVQGGGSGRGVPAGGPRGRGRRRGDEDPRPARPGARLPGAGREPGSAGRKRDPGRWRRRRPPSTCRRRRTPSTCAGCTSTTRSPRWTPSSTASPSPRRRTLS